MDPEKRLTCSELLRLPYLAGVEATIPATTLRAQVSTGTSMLDSPLLCCHCRHLHDVQYRRILVYMPYLLASKLHVMCGNCAQEKAAEEREALGKMRKQKRKSADLEPESAPRAVISLTASSHASIPDGPRCSLSLLTLHSLPCM